MCYIVNIISIYILFFTFSVFSAEDNFFQTKALTKWTPKKSLQEIIYEKELQRFWSLIKVETLFFRFGRGEIVLLYGTSCAGKTSVCQALHRMYPEWSFESLDQSIDRYLVNLLQKLFPQECRLIRTAFAEKDIIAVIFEGQREFRKSASSSLQLQAIQACSYIKQQGALIDQHFSKEKAKQAMFERSFLKSMYGQSVVIDTIGFYEFLTYKELCSFYCPIRYVLVYYPLSKLSERIAKRNREAELKKDTSDLRYGVNPFFQFAKLYKISLHNCECAIEVINHEYVVTSFDFNFDEDVRRFPRNSLLESEKERDKGKKELLEKLGFNKTETFFVKMAPRFYSDLILNTDQMSPYECAHSIGRAHAHAM